MCRPASAWACLLLAGLAACNRPASTDATDADSTLPEPDPLGCLVPSIDSLDLSTLDLREDASARVEMALQLDNPCAGPVLVDEVSLVGEGLQLVGTLSGPIAAGESRTVRVSWAPRAPIDLDGVLTVVVSNAAEATTTIPVRGRALAPRLALDPEVLDLGEPPVGCVASGVIRMRNTGNVPLVLESSSLLGEDAASFEATIKGPITLQPSASSPRSFLDVRVSRRSLDDEPARASLAVRSTDPIRPEAEARLTAGGTSRPVTDRHTVPEPRVDLLYVVNRETTAVYPQVGDAVVNSVEHALTAFASLGVRPRISLTVQDGGCVLGPDVYIDGSFSPSRARAAMEAMFDRDNTAGFGVDFQRGLQRSEAALDPANTAPGACNEGLNRPYASLGIVYVSRVPDSSSKPWGNYVASLESLVAEPDDLTLHAVVGPRPSGCEFGAVGVGYLEAVAATGGSSVSICDFTASDIEGLVRATRLHGGSIRIGREPVEETIAVRVDGEPWVGGFTHQTEPFRHIRFEEVAPRPGQTVDVRYDPKVDCPE